MRVPRIDFDEDARLSALDEYDLTDSSVEPALVRITDLAARMFGVPSAFVSLLERHRQIFHAKVGLALCETGREEAFCSHTIGQHDILVVLDSRLDPRFHDNPLVIGEPGIRFYAGIPLRAPSGHAIGTLCLIDQKPRNSFTEIDRRNLSDLAQLVLNRLELRRLDVARRASQSRFEQISGTSPDGIVCADQQGRITFWNASAARLFGYAAEEALGRNIDLVVPERMRGGHIGLQQVAGGRAPRLVGRTVELPARHRDGTEFPIELSLSMWQEDGQTAFGTIIRDIRERRANEERLFRLAHLDPLTELPNRTVLRSRIGEIVALNRPLAVLMLDLDGFKEVNDTLGHAAGDRVLTATAKRLLGCVRPGDTVSRLGGDEFAILLPDIDDPCGAEETAGGLIRALSEPFVHEGQLLRLSASVGIALAPSQGSTSDELLSCADMALYRAKAEGRSCHRLFTPALRTAAQRERTCRDELRLAVEREEFVLFYQPQVRLDDGGLAGAEALIRWQHPGRGLLPPSAFLAALDRSEHAAEVGDWVVRTACRQAVAWRRQGASDFRIGVNLCTAQFQRGDLARKVLDILRQTGLPPEGLELEITENIILRHNAELTEPLCSLRRAGIGIAFDDYGTGYASLSLLKRFPLTRLKIDQSFVRGMCESMQDAAIVHAVLDLSRSFGLAVIAEGVETEDQRQRLRAKGCPEAQGYLFGKPMPASEFTGFLHRAATPPAAVA